MPTEMYARRGEQAYPGEEKMQVAAGTSNRHVEHEGQWQINQRRTANSSRFAPIEPRVRQENGDPAHQQNDKVQRGQPVRDAHQRRVSAGLRICGCGASGGKRAT